MKITMDWGDFRGRLFERETEQSRLLETFERQTQYDAKREFILITGRSGTGKTALASTTLQRTTKSRGGFYIQGKFDQFQRAEPYAPFKASFTAFASYIVSQAPRLISTIKVSIRENVDSMDAAVLMNVVPALKPLLDIPEDQIHISSFMGADESQRQKRITTAFCNLTKAICSPERPLVILIDDLQWADTCSLRLLYALTASDNIEGGLVLVGTCRNDEVEYAGELAILLRKLEDEMNINVNEFYLENLDAERVKRMISGIFSNFHPSSLQPLANFVFKTTNGNIFYVLELLKYLEEKGCIYKDNYGSNLPWRYDETRLLSTKYAESVQNLIIDKVKGLPNQIYEILQVAACLGSDFDETLLSDLIDTTHLSDALETALNKTLILKSDRPRSYKFAHDSIQHAAYTSILPEVRSDYHLTIGRDLYTALLVRNELNNNIYLVVNQLQKGIDLIDSQDEKNVLAELCLQAGEKAIKSSDYNTAASYFEYGIGILGEDHWRQEHRLSLQLFDAAAEVFYYLADWKKTDALVKSVLENARSAHDKSRSYRTNILAVVAKGRFSDVFPAMFEALNELGENMDQDFGKLKLVSELVKTKALLLLKRQKVKKGLKLQLMRDRNKIAILEVLNICFSLLTVRESNLLPMIILRMMQLTLQYGVCSLAPVAFSCYGMIMCASGSYSEGFKFGRLALDFLEQSEPSEWEARVHVMVYGLIWDWNKPIRLAIKPLYRAAHLGLASGDLDIAMVGGYQYCVKLFYVAPLEQLTSETKNFLKQMQNYEHTTFSPYLSIILQLSHNFMGLSPNPLILTGDAMDETKVLEKAMKTKHIRLEIAVYIYGLVLAFTFNDYERAFMLSKKAAGLKYSKVSSFNSCLLIFFEGLTSIALAKTSTDSRKRSEYYQVAKQSIRKMKRLAEQVPENCLHKQLLLEAEFDVLEGRYVKGLDKYIRSIEFAKQEGFLHEHALACERVGLSYYSPDDSTKDEPSYSVDFSAISGKKYLSEAFSLYKEWGAHAKAEQMQSRYPFLSGQVKGQ